MKFKDYAKKINEILKDNAEAGEFEVIYSIDDEGNNFNPVIWDPSKGHMNRDGFDAESENKPNAVCVN